MTHARSMKLTAFAALAVGLGAASDASACARAELIFHHGRNYPRGAIVAEVLITGEGGYQRAEARVLRMIQGPRTVRRLHLRNMQQTVCSYPPRVGQRGVIVAAPHGREGGIPVVLPSLE